MFLSACKSSVTGSLNEVSSMRIKSFEFENNGFIPRQFSCDGENVPPVLVFENIPSNAKSLALIVDDPDAPGGTFTHWLVWNIPPTVYELSKNNVNFPQGVTDFGKIGYGGPCPPSGTHRYFFKLFALDTVLNLEQGASRKQLEQAMQGHIIEKAELIGKYNRK